MFIFQQNRSPSNFHREVRQYLNTVLPGCWVGCASGNDQPLMLWPPRFSHITPCDFFLWEAVKDWVFVAALPHDLVDLKAWIIAAMKNIDAPMFTHVCGKNLNIVSMCVVSPMVHTSNISSCKKEKLFQFSYYCEQFH